jgi:hypothetical protein
MHLRIIIFLYILTSTVFAQRDHRLDFNIAYPIIISSFPTKGIIAADIKYNRRVTPRHLYISAGPSFSLFQDFDKQTMQNFGIDIGINKAIAIHPSINVYPYMNIGFTNFKYNSDKISNGAQTEVGISICHTSIRHWLGLHIGYKYYFLDKFDYEPSHSSIKGHFGLLTTGLHFHL